MAWLTELDREVEDLRAALGWLLSSAEQSADGPARAETVELSLRLAGALWWYWQMRGHYNEAIDRLARALAQPGGEPASRAKAQTGLGYLCAVTGDFDRAVADLEHALALRQRIGEPYGIISTLNLLGNAMFLMGNIERARSIHTEALALRQESGDRQGIALSLGNLGTIANLAGDYAEATALFEQALRERRAAGDTWAIIVSLHHLAIAALNQGDIDRAETLFTETWPHLRELGLRGYRPWWHLHAALAHERGRSEQAVRLFGAAAALLEEGREGMRPYPPERNFAVTRRLGELRSLLGDDTFEAAWTAGRALAHDASFTEMLLSADDDATGGQPAPA